MKKNFFKKLSFVMALAMIISVIAPAAGAFAATKAPKLNVTGKTYLHLAKDGADEFDFNISNKKAGWTYEWKSANEAVAVVDDANGVTTATGVGTTKVSVVISDKDGEEVDTLAATVVVRDNIATLAIKNAPAKDVVKVNVAYDFNRSFVTVANSTTKTSAITRWVVKEEGATITDAGLFTATKAGTYTVVATAFQSKAKYDAYKTDAVKYASYALATAEATVVVAASMGDVKQTGLATFTIAFDTEMTDVAKNLTVSALVGTSKVKQLVKEVKMDDAKKVATVTAYVNFTPETVYVVDYTDMKSAQFTAVTTKVEDVANIAITTTSAVLNVEKAVEVKLTNAAGVDISTSTLLDRVSMKSTNDANTYFNTTSKKITMYLKGATTTVTATFHTYKYNTTTGAEEGTKEVSALINCVEADATNVTGVNAWTIIDSTATPNFSDVKQTIAAGDAGKKLFVELKTLTGTTEAKVNNFKDGYFEFSSTDESVLMVTSTGVLVPNKAGSADVLVKYSATATGTKTTVGAVTVTVGVERKATNLTLSTYEFVLSNSSAITDSKDVEITLKDQLGSDFTYTTYKIEKLGGPDVIAATADDHAYGNTLVTPGDAVLKGNGKITFTGKDMAAGTYTYRITVKDIARVVQVSVQKPDEATAKYYKLSLSAASTDIAAADEKVNKNLTIQLFGYSTNGVKVTEETLGATEAAAFTVDVDAPDATPTKDADNINGTYALATAVSGGAVVKVPVGSFKVTATKKNADGVQVPVDIQYFTVSDTQKAPIIGEVKTRLYTLNVDSYVATGSSLIAAAKECFKITLDGVDYNDKVVSVEATGTGSSTYIKSITVRQTIEIDNTTTNTTYIDHKVVIESNITKK